MTLPIGPPTDEILYLIDLKIKVYSRCAVRLAGEHFLTNIENLF